MPKLKYTTMLKRNEELEKEIESLRSSYDAVLSSMKEKIQQMQTDIAKHETSISDHTVDFFYNTFGGTEYITEEIASILASMLSNPDEHSILALAAAPQYHLHRVDGIDGSRTIESTLMNSAQKCSTVNCNGYGTAWCVQCCYKNPLVPCFLCHSCAASDGDVHKTSLIASRLV